MCCSKFIFQYRLKTILKCTSIAKDILNAYRPDQALLPHTPRTQPKRKSEAAVPESWSAVTRACTNEYFAYPTEALANALMQGARVARRDRGGGSPFLTCSAARRACNHKQHEHRPKHSTLTQDRKRMRPDVRARTGTPLRAAPQRLRLS